MPEYTVVDIGEDQLDAAYFLARAIAPHLSREDWVDRVRALDGSSGILGLSGPGGTLIGILAYQKQQMLRHGPTLAIDTMVVFELARLGAGKRMLLDSAFALAERLDCAAVAFPAEDRKVVPLARNATQMRRVQATSGNPCRAPA